MAAADVKWSSKFAFVLAAAGAAVGLGNIWRFPYIVGENGGGAFVLIYVLFVLILGIPLLMSEILVGRRGQHNAVSSFRILARFSGKTPLWALAGALPLFAGFLILTYYSVIIGWVLDFFVHSIIDTFKDVSVEQTNQIFNNLLSNPMQMLFWDTLIIASTIFIIARGIHKGLEKSVYIMFPVLILLIIVLIIYAIRSGSFGQGFAFLFHPNFSQLTGHSVLIAMGQAFYSLSIGMGTMITYGKYVDQNTSIAKTCTIIALMDTIVALIVGLAIFPVVFATGLKPDVGPSLIFKTLPVAFGHMPAGDLFASLFFLMLLLAGFTSAISLLEPSVVWVMERFKWTRIKATTVVGFVIWVISLATIASFNLAAHIKIVERNFFELLDYTTSNVMLPLAGLLVATFTGWCMSKQDTKSELQVIATSKTYRFWRFSMRFIAPIAIIFIFLNAIGVF